MGLQCLEYELLPTKVAQLVNLLGWTCSVSCLILKLLLREVTKILFVVM